MQPTIIGLDLAKLVFQVHGVDERGTVVLTKRLRRGSVLRTCLRTSRADGLGSEALQAP